MHVFDAKTTAISFVEGVKKLSEGSTVWALVGPHIKRFIKIGLVESKLL
jgi:hypothetical protein